MCQNFLFKAEQFSSILETTSPYQLIYQWTLGCFYLSAVGNYITINTGIQISLQDLAFYFFGGCTHRSGIAGSYGSVQFRSLSHVRLCDPIDCSTPGFPVHHQLLELTQTHVHWAGDAIQPSNPLSAPSLPAFNLSQHQGLFQLVSSLHQWVSASASAFPMNIQDWFPLELTGLISLLSKGHSRVFSNTTVQKHQFFGTQLSL